MRVHSLHTRKRAVTNQKPSSHTTPVSQSSSRKYMERGTSSQLEEIQLGT